MFNFWSVVDHHAERFPERKALGLGGREVGYGELRDRSQAVARGLAASGLGRGDVVAALLENSVEFVELLLATSYLGGIFLPLNYRLAAAEIEFIVEHSGARAVVTQDGLAPRLAGVKAGVRRWVVDGGAGGEPYEALSDPQGRADPPAAVGADDLMRLMYTSGTTARPKGVMITFGNLYWKNVAHLVELELSSRDVGLACGPLYHVGALDLTTTTVLYAGGSVELLPRFDVAGVVETVERERVTNLWLAPAMINAILAGYEAGTRDLASVRLVVDGGEKMPAPLIKRVHEVFPRAWFADAYGLTETVSGDTFLDKRSTYEKIGSVGRPCLHLEVAIWNDDGEPVGAGEPGEIVLRGPKVCAGYWRDEEATSAAFANGWFRTGDVGYLDSEGLLYLIDRKKDLIVSGGENVASLEVERVLYQHPQVREAAVVGAPDSRWNEVPVAFVVAHGEEIRDELEQLCRAQLAGFKVPKAFVFVGELPRNASGKVLKKELRVAAAETYRAEHGLRAR